MDPALETDWSCSKPLRAANSGHSEGLDIEAHRIEAHTCILEVAEEELVA